MYLRDGKLQRDWYQGTEYQAIYRFYLFLKALGPRLPESETTSGLAYNRKYRS